MAKVLITADIHFGVSGRLSDILWGVRVMREYARRSGIDKVICLGDMFHDRCAMDLDVMCAAYDFLSETKKSYGQEWITFPGNHDMFLKHSWQINSLRVFQEHLTVIDDVKILQMNDARFWVLPFIHLESAYMRVLKAMSDRAGPDDILLTHVGTVGAVKNVCFMLKDWSMVSFEGTRFRKVYTGHFHAPQHVGGNVWYPGSPMPFKFDEGDCIHGFIVHDLDTGEHEFVDIVATGVGYFPDEVPPPNYVTVPEEMVCELPESVVSNNIIRVARSGEMTDNQMSGVAETLASRGARAVRWLTVASEESFANFRERVSASASADVFEAWLEADADGRKGLDVGLLRSLHVSVADEADSLYDYGDSDD